MRKFLSLFAAIFFAASMMAESYTITFKDGGTDSDKTASLTSTTVADYVDAGAEYVSAIAPEGKVYYAKSGAGLKFGNSSGGGKVTLTLATPIKPTSIVVSASQFGASEGSGQFQGQTFDMTAGGGKYSFNDYTVTYDGNTEVTTIAVGTAKRGYVKSITVNYVAEQGGQGGEGGEESNTMTVYCQMTQSWWTADGAAVAVHYWGGEADATAWPGARMNAVAGQEGLWSYDVPADVEGLMFVRVNGSGDIADWGAKTANLTLPTDGKNLYTITSESPVWGDPGCAGVWSVYGEEPAEPILANGFYLVGTMNNWTPEAANLFVATEANPAEYKLTVTLAENDGIKVVKVTNDQIVAWYPDGMENEYIVDAAHAGADKDIYFQETYKEDWAEFGGYFWTGTTEIPVADFTKPFVLKFNGNGSSDNSNTFKVEDGVAAIFDNASAPYVSSLTTVSNVYAGRTIADEPSSLKFGASSKQGTLAFMLSEAIEVDSIIVNATQYGNNASKITINDVEFDITAGNKIPQDFVIIPENEVSEIVISQSSSERLYLRYVKVFPHVAGEEPETPAKYYITGDSALVGAELQWHPDALKAEQDTMVLNLAAGDYKLKVTVNGDWSTGKGYSELTVKAEGLSADNDNNIIFTLAEAGNVTVVYNDSVFTVSGEFYVEPAPVIVTKDLALVPGVWAEADAVLAAWAWGAEAAGAWSAFEGAGDTLIAKINEKADSVIFVRFEANAAIDWASNIWDRTENLEIDSCGIYFINDWDNYTWCEAPAPVIPAKYYITGDSALVGTELQWHPDAIKVMEDEYIFENLAAGEYKLKVTVDGDWATVKGYSELTVKAEGLSADNDNNIIFTLAEAGNVTVVYNDSVFTVSGAFYVEPAPVIVTKDLALVPGVWAEADAVLAAWAWGAEAAGAWSAFAGAGDTLIAKINEKADSVIFVRFEANAAIDWASNIWDRTENLEIDSCGIYFINDWDNYSWCEAPAPVIPAKYYITGDSALVGTELQWHPDALKAEQDTMVLNLAAGDYKLKVTVNGDWSTGKGYSDLTVKAEGLSTDGDNNVIFTLAEAGNVTVVYNDSVFTVSGEFYVEPVVTIADGYYLVGSMNGWAPVEGYKFELFEDGVQYKLTTALALDDELKVVYVENDVITAYYPAEGANYIVDAAHVGAAVDIYFRPDGFGGEDWYYQFFYVLPNGIATEIENANADANAIKVLRNGMIIIEKNGKQYNILGIRL